MEKNIVNWDVSVILSFPIILSHILKLCMKLNLRIAILKGKIIP